MSYCTVADMTARFGEIELAQLTDLEDRETVNAVTVQAAITDASGEIDSYLAGRYALPISDALPDMLRAGCMDLARYRLYDDHPPDVVKARRADFVTWLNRVAIGHVQLPLSAAGVDALTSGLASTDPATDDDVPTFTRLVW